MQRIRTPSQVTGGLTDAEWEMLKKHNALWCGRAQRTTPTDHEETERAIMCLYNAASLKAPVVVVVCSPGVMAFAGTFLRHLLGREALKPGGRTKLPAPTSINCHSAYLPFVDGVLAAMARVLAGVSCCRDSPDSPDIGNATLAATYELVDAPSAEALDRQTNMDIRYGLDHAAMTDQDFAIREAMKEPFGNSVLTQLMLHHVQEWGQPLASAIFEDKSAARTAIEEVCDWWQYGRGGTQSAYWAYCVTAIRDVLGVPLFRNDRYTVWEDAVMAGVIHYMHPAFCLSCDFPSSIVSKNLTSYGAQAQNIYRWSDGWEV